MWAPHRAEQFSTFGAGQNEFVDIGVPLLDGEFCEVMMMHAFA